MPPIKQILEKYSDDFSKIVNTLCVDTMEGRTPASYKEEYDGERTRRQGSVGWRENKRLPQYSDTLVDNNGNPVRLEDKVVRVNRIATNFPRRLVRTDVAMIFGGNQLITAETMDDGFAEFKRVWTRVLGMQDVLMEFAERVMSETKAAIVFYPSVYTHWSEEETTEVNCKILSLPHESYKLYEFYPHFDGGRMDGFIHRYHTKNDEGTLCEQVEIYTREKLIDARRENGTWYVQEKPNKWGLIPVVYAEVSEPAWDEVAEMMDAREMRLSRMADTNDYFSEPILKTFGETDLPSKDTTGKELCFPIQVDPDTGKPYHGDADYLSWQQSIDSVEKELDTTRSEMYAGASTPDLSFENLKGIGNLSGVARRFMMLDAEIKAKINMRVFRPALMRCITVVTAGIANITGMRYKDQLKANWIDIQFESILPKDPVEDAQVLSTAIGGKAFNSLQTVVSCSPLTPQGDLEDELKRMEEEAQKDAERYTAAGQILPE